MKAYLTQLYISIKLMLNGRHEMRKEAFLEWEGKIASASLADSADTVFFISDKIAHEFGWAKMIQMRHLFQRASHSARNFSKRFTVEGRQREYVAARQALQIFPSDSAICRTWNKQVARWEAELAAISGIENSAA